MIWRAAILLAASTSLGAAPKDAATDSLRRGIKFLVSQQGRDGGWHSTTYGSMKQGAAVTSLVLYAMSRAPAKELASHRKIVLQGYEFLRQGVERTGFVTNPDGSADFPTYASSMLLLAAKRLDLPMTNQQRLQLTRFVVAAQLTETRQFGVENPHHGGWDLMGAQRVIGRTSGTNVSISRFAAEALALSDTPGSRAALQRARRWSAGVQNLSADGGFFFTPDADSENNKAFFDRDDNETTIARPRSYGTCTCDGVLLLLASGLTPDDKRVAAALKWIVGNPDVEVVPGFLDDAQRTGWQEGLRFYFYAALAQTLRYMPEKHAASRRTALTELLVAAQESDGRWKNSSARMREDDPLICTSLAVTALATLLRRGSR